MAESSQSAAGASGTDGKVADTNILGPLRAFVGTWTGSKGKLIMPVPSPGSTPDSVGKFQALTREYEETWTFTPVKDPVRNRGGAVDQFVGALQYEQVVRATDGKKETLHVENGMMLYLGNRTGDTVPPGELHMSPTIARSATVPHGDSCMLLGFSPSTVTGPPKFDDVPSEWLVPSNEGTGPPLGYSDVYLTPATSPFQALSTALKGQTVEQTQTFFLDSEVPGSVGGGITNTPFINRFAKPANFKTFFWFETVKDPNPVGPASATYTQLQYLQVIGIDFHKPFGDNPQGLIRWPHLLANTLTGGPAP